jgi:hypothetical protein
MLVTVIIVIEHRKQLYLEMVSLISPNIHLRAAPEQRQSRSFWRPDCIYSRRRTARMGPGGRGVSRGDVVMMRLRVAAIVLPTMALLLASCSSTVEGLAPVKGKVVCDGQPASGAILLFHRQAGEPPLPPAVAGVIPSAIVGDDGSFSVESAALGSGAAPGKYNVLVQWPDRGDSTATGSGAKTKTTSVGGKAVVVVKHDKRDPLASDRLKGRYSDAGKPQLKAEIKPGPTDLGTLEITLN